MSELETKPTSSFLRKYGRQIFVALAANVGAFEFGTAWSWTATALPSMEIEWHSNPVQESWITSILFLGCIFSSPISSYCIEKFGRKATMLWANVPCLLAWILIGFASNMEQVYLGRFIIGTCTACYGSAAPLYVSETSFPNIRGRLVCSFDSMIVAGLLFINIIGAFISWRFQAFVCGIIPILGFAMLTFVPESPRFLMNKNNVIGTKQSLTWLQPTSSEMEIQEELNQIGKSCGIDKAANEQFGWKVIWEPCVYKPILIGCMLMFFHQFSGNYPILAYGISVFSKVGSGNPYVGISVVNAAQFVASIIPIFVVDKVGRRPLLIISEIGMTITLATFGIYFYFQETFGSDSPMISNLSWIPMTALIIYEICYAVGIGPLPWLLMGEIVSSKQTGLSLGIITCFYRVLGFTQLFFFHDLRYGIYYFFALCCFIGAFACYYFVPDTTGKTLDEIRNPNSTLVQKSVPVVNSISFGLNNETEGKSSHQI